MFLKIIVLFLVLMMTIGMVGKLINPTAKPKGKKARKCKTCGSFIIGNGPCATCASRKK